MPKTHVGARIEKESYAKIEKLANTTRLEKSEIIRRVILIGLKHVQKPEDLLKI